MKIFYFRICFSEGKIDEFADFTSAFSSTVSTGTHPVNTNVNTIATGLGNINLNQPLFSSVPVAPLSNHILGFQNNAPVIANGKVSGIQAE